MILTDIFLLLLLCFLNANKTLKIITIRFFSDAIQIHKEFTPCSLSTPYNDDEFIENNLTID